MTKFKEIFAEGFISDTRSVELKIQGDKKLQAKALACDTPAELETVVRKNINKSVYSSDNVDYEYLFQLLNK